MPRSESVASVDSFDGRPLCRVSLSSSPALRSARSLISQAQMVQRCTTRMFMAVARDQRLVNHDIYRVLSPSAVKVQHEGVGIGAKIGQDESDRDACGGMQAKIALAEKERRIISRRAIEALASVKARPKLGGWRTGARQKRQQPTGRGR
jgi:hypothetical protein